MIIPLFPEIPPCIRFISLEDEYDPPFPEVLYNLENLQLFLLSNLAMTLGQILQTKNGKYLICLFQELKQMTWNAPGEAVPIVLDCVNKAGFKISQVQFNNYRIQ